MLYRVIGLFFILFTACTARRALSGERCNLNTDCREPLVCRSSVCREECRDHRDCPTSFYCVAFTTEDPTRFCWQPARCIRPRDCEQFGPEFRCVNNFCVYECDKDRDCKGRGTCDLERHVCTGAPDAGESDADAATEDAVDDAPQDAPEDASEDASDEPTEDAGNDATEEIADDAGDPDAAADSGPPPMDAAVD